MHDRPYDAAFRAMAVREFMDYGITYAFPFALGDGPPHGHEGFAGSLAMFTKATIPKPSFAVFELLDRMRGNRAPCRSSNPPVGGLACLAPAGGPLWILLYNILEDYRHAPYTTQVEVRVQNLPPGRWRAVRTDIAPGKCDPWKVWHALGEPEPLTAEQRRRLLEAAQLPPPEAIPVHGNVLRFRMPGFSASLIELTPGH